MEKIMLMLCLLLAVGSARSQDGCPQLKAGISGSCAESCSSDGDCARGQKCCSNGCGHQCTACVAVTCTKPGCHVTKDKNGCEYCQCDDVKPSCDSLVCPAGQRCVLLEVQCVRAPCPPVPQCIGKPKCPPANCSPHCVPRKDPDGCEFCDCKDPCRLCAMDQECQLVYPPCPRPPCPPIGVCKDKPKCHPVKCGPDCVPKKDVDGCEYCDCGPPCKHCRKDQECEIFYPPCAGPPCAPPVGVCKDKRKCPSVSCSPSCPVSKGPDGCDFCDCRDPCEKCRKDQECELQYLPCDRSGCLPPVGICKDKPKCPPVRCSPECELQMDSKGCMFCDCGHPCEHCREDQECEIVYPPCDEGLFCGPPTGVCKDKPKCPLVRCTPECPAHRGADGCPFCDCTDPCQNCRPGQMCEVLYPSCLDPPCLPPIGTCKDPPAPPADKRCAARPRLMHCFFPFTSKYIYDVNYGRCRRLRRRTCSAGENKFRTMRECEAACQAKPAGGGHVAKPPITVGPI